jgi:hypothetical protein
MNTITFLKEVKNYHATKDDATVLETSKLIKEYLDLVCDTKGRILKTSLGQMLRTDIALKAMTQYENERFFFLGKENAFRQVAKLIEDVENSEFADLLAQLNHGYISKK